MIRVRICTSRCRCQSNWRTSRFSGLGTQIRGKRSSIISFSSSCASLRSVFCFLTRLAFISAGSPIHTSNPNSASSRSNQRVSGRLHPHSHVDSSQLQGSIELLGLPIAVVQSSFAIFAGLLHQKCNLLKARVIIYAYHHVRLLPPEPLVVKQPKCTQVEGADTVMQSSHFHCSGSVLGDQPSAEG